MEDCNAKQIWTTKTLFYDSVLSQCTNTNLLKIKTGNFSILSLLCHILIRRTRCSKWRVCLNRKWTLRKTKFWWWLNFDDFSNQIFQKHDPVRYTILKLLEVNSHKFWIQNAKYFKNLRFLCNIKIHGLYYNRLP